MRGDPQHPATDATAVERNTHDVAELQLVAKLVGNEVVELLVDARDVGQHLGDERRRCHTPIAEDSSSSRLVCSQVKSAPLRPKWPYAAVRR